MTSQADNPRVAPWNNSIPSHGGDSRVPPWNPMGQPPATSYPNNVTPWKPAVASPQQQRINSWQNMSFQPVEPARTSTNYNGMSPPPVTSHGVMTSPQYRVYDSHQSPEHAMSSAQSVTSRGEDSRSPSVLEHSYAEIPSDSFRFLPQANNTSTNYPPKTEPPPPPFIRECTRPNRASLRGVLPAIYPITYTTESDSSSPDSGLGYCGGSSVKALDVSSDDSGRGSGRCQNNSLVIQTQNINSKQQEVVRSLNRKRKLALNALVFFVVGLVYIGIGAAVGFFLGKAYCNNDSAMVIVPASTTSSNPYDATTARQNVTVPATHPTTTVSPYPIVTPSTTTVMPDIATSTTTSNPSLCRQEPGLCTCGLYGGPQGDAFSDHDNYNMYGNITGFSIRYNAYVVFGLQFSFGGQQAGQHGYTSSGFTTTVTMNTGETITHVQVDFTQGQQFLTQVIVHTNIRVLGPYGGRGEQSFKTYGDRLLYISGRSGPMVDQMTLYYDKCQ